MRNLTKMTLANRGREKGGRGSSMEMGYAYGGGNGGNIENRRDRRGRYAPRNEGMNNGYGGTEGAYNEDGSVRMGHDGGWVVKPIEDKYGPENRRDSMGRYAPRNEGPENWMPPYWESQMEGGRYRMGDDGGRMIGFEGGMENQMRMGHGQKKGMEQMQMGGREGYGGNQKLDQRTAVEWVNKMENSDGSRGEHFTMEQTERVRKNKGLECDPIEFWVAMNAMWSDGAATARKYNIDKIDYWADRAKEFIMDKDAGPGKMARYYRYIVKQE